MEFQRSTSFEKGCKNFCDTGNIEECVNFLTQEFLSLGITGISEVAEYNHSKVLPNNENVDINENKIFDPLQEEELVWVVNNCYLMTNKLREMHDSKMNLQDSHSKSQHELSQARGDVERGKERLGRMTRKLQVSESQNQLLNEKLLEGEKLLKKEKNEVRNLRLELCRMEEKGRVKVGKLQRQLDEMVARLEKSSRGDAGVEKMRWKGGGSRKALSSETHSAAGISTGTFKTQRKPLTYDSSSHRTLLHPTHKISLNISHKTSLNVSRRIQKNFKSPPPTLNLSSPHPTKHASSHSVKNISVLQTSSKLHRSKALATLTTKKLLLSDGFQVHKKRKNTLNRQQQQHQIHQQQQHQQKQQHQQQQKLEEGKIKAQSKVNLSLGGKVNTGGYEGNKGAKLTCTRGFVVKEFLGESVGSGVDGLLEGEGLARSSEACEGEAGEGERTSDTQQEHHHKHHQEQHQEAINSEAHGIHNMYLEADEEEEEEDGIENALSSGKDNDCDGSDDEAVEHDDDDDDNDDGEDDDDDGAMKGGSDNDTPVDGRNRKFNMQVVKAGADESGGDEAKDGCEEDVEARPRRLIRTASFTILKHTDDVTLDVCMNVKNDVIQQSAQSSSHH